MHMPPDPLVPFARSEKDREFLRSVVTSQREKSAAEKAVREQPGIGPDDIKHTGSGVQPSRSLSDSEYDSFQTALTSEPGFSQTGSRRFRANNPDKLDAPDPFEVTQQRSATAVERDRQRQARVTTDVETYASDPNSYDFPFVDTPPEFNKQYENDNSLIPGNVDKDMVQDDIDSGFDF